MFSKKGRTAASEATIINKEAMRAADDEKARSKKALSADGSETSGKPAADRGKPAALALISMTIGGVVGGVASGIAGSYFLAVFALNIIVEYRSHHVYRVFDDLFLIGNPTLSLFLGLALYLLAIGLLIYVPKMIWRR